MICRICGSNLSIDGFRKDKHYKNGYMTVCKGCMSVKENTTEAKEKKREQAKKWRLKNPDYYTRHSVSNEKRKEYNKKYKEKNIEKYREYYRLRAKTHAEQNRNNKFKRSYGITIIDYNKILDEQNYRCAICGWHLSSFKKRFCVDHDHRTHKVRGLVCDQCNNLLGRAYDNIDILKAAIIYLEKSNN